MSLLSEAEEYTRHGFGVIPLNKDKKSIIKWASKRGRIATKEELIEYFYSSSSSNSNGKAKGIGLIINNTEFAIDTDGSGESVFKTKVIPRLSSDLQNAVNSTMRTKTPNGHHRTFRVRQQDFPDGVSEREYWKLIGEGKHDEIVIKGNRHYLVERGEGYENINGVERLVTLPKEQVDELLKTLEIFRSETNVIKTATGTLKPFYQQTNRDRVSFALSGFLHRGGVPEYLIHDTISYLVDITNDNEPQKRFQVVKDTCAKDPNSDQVSGYTKLIEALDNNENAIAEIEQPFSQLGYFKGGTYHSAWKNGGGIKGNGNVCGEKELPPDILAQLTGHIYKVIGYNPLTFIVGDKDRKEVIKSVVITPKFNTTIKGGDKTTTSTSTTTPSGMTTTTTTKTSQKYTPKHVIIDAVPIKVIINDNPMDGNKTYQITFTHRFSKRPFTLGPGTVNFIIEELQNRGRFVRARDAVEALTAILVTYEDKELAEINSRIPQSGYYYHADSNRIVGNDTTQQDIDATNSEEDRKKILECIDILEGLYARNKNKNIFSTVLKWGVVAPFGYAKKCMDSSGSNWLPFLQPWGWTRTGKNTQGRTVLAIWRKHGPKDALTHMIGFGNANTDARLGLSMSKTTYPVVINETGGLISDKNYHIVELIKHAVESLNVRGAYKENRRYANTPALSNLILTSNYPPPQDPAYRIRVIPLHFDKSHETTEQEKEEFNKWYYEENRIDKLGVLGDFAAKYIIVNPDTLRKQVWSEIGKMILVEFYKAVGKDPPEWIELLVKDNVVEQASEETYFERGFLEQAIVDGYRKDFKIDPNTGSETFDARIKHCLTYRTVPFLLEHYNTKTDKTDIVITYNIIPELLRRKIPNITSLSVLANEIPGFRYGLVKINGKPMKVAYGSHDDFRDFLSCEIEEEGGDAGGEQKQLVP